jgi:biofilm PGA synthesis N-glycosyltransferase PgaC
MVALFWISLFLVFYAYAGYPLLLRIYAGWGKIKDNRRNYQPFVSVVIAVLNEEATIRSRLENLLKQDYPKEKLDIVVVSDGSADRTCEMVRQFAFQGVVLLELTARQGKALALNAGVAEAKGELVVFADARQRFAPDAISALASNFSDPEVGCASGELFFVRDNTSLIEEEMGAYWNYEKWVRKMESATGSVVGATGAIYAIRRALYRPLPPDTILDDVLTPLTVIGLGYRCMFDNSAVAYDIISKNASQEWRRKVRTLAGNWQLMSLRPRLFVPWSNPIWWRFVSHKILRLLVPFALVSVAVSGLLIAGGLYMGVSLVLMLLCLCAAAGALIPSARMFKLMSVNFFFMVMNAAVLGGFLLWISGRCGSTWRPETAKDVKVSD